MIINNNEHDIRISFKHTSNDQFRQTQCIVDKVVTGGRFNTDGILLCKGLATCSPKDNFCKDTGRKIALARAIGSMNKEWRTMIWNAYFNRNMVSENV